MNSRSLALLGLLAVGGLSVAPALSQDAEPSGLFTQSVEVRVINIDVFATDRKGRPVTDLVRDDFVLMVDGQPTEVEYFYTFQPEATAEARAAGGQGSAALSQGSGEPRSAGDPLFVIYIDNYWLTPVERVRVLDDVQGFVEALAPEGLRFLVVTHDPGITLRTTVTRDASEVLGALEALHEEPARGLDAYRDRERVFDGVRAVWEMYEASPQCSDPCRCGWGEMIMLWQNYARSSAGRMQVSGNGMGDLLAALSGVPGRKALLYVAAGLQQRPGLDVLHYLTEVCPEFQREGLSRVFEHDESSNLENLGATANSSRVTLYPLDAGGLRADSAASVVWASPRLRPSGMVGQIERANLQNGLELLADVTGGEAILNANNPLEPLLELESDFGPTYSLGFTPDGVADDMTHRVKVLLNGRSKGVRLRYRQSYVDRSLDSRLVDRVVGTITFAEESNSLGVRARLGEPTPLARNEFSLPVHVDVDVDNLTLMPAADGASTGRFRVFLAAASADGVRTLVRQEFFDVTPGDIEQGTMSIVVRMFLEPGEYAVGVGVRDEVSEESSYLALATTSSESTRSE